MLFGQGPGHYGTSDTPDPAEYDQVLGLTSTGLPGEVLVTASITLRKSADSDHVSVRSALVRPDYAEDLQRALASASDPTDWKLPDEDERDFEVALGAFEMRGWLTTLPEDHYGLDEHDPYAHGLSRTLPLPGQRFRDESRLTPDPAGLRLLDQHGTAIVRAEQWADPIPERDREATFASSGYRVRIRRDALLGYLARSGFLLILEVQFGRYRSGTGVSGDWANRSRIYLVHPDGRVTAR